MAVDVLVFVATLTVPLRRPLSWVVQRQDEPCRFTGPIFCLELSFWTTTKSGWIEFVSEKLRTLGNICFFRRCLCLFSFCVVVHTHFFVFFFVWSFVKLCVLLKDDLQTFTRPMGKRAITMGGDSRLPDCDLGPATRTKMTTTTT